MADYSDVINGLRLLASKQPANAQVSGADHDVLFGAPLDVELTEGETADLERWGWHKSREYDCWCHFV